MNYVRPASEDATSKTTGKSDSALHLSSSNISQAPPMSVPAFQRLRRGATEVEDASTGKLGPGM